MPKAKMKCAKAFVLDPVDKARKDHGFMQCVRALGLSYLFLLLLTGAGLFSIEASVINFGSSSEKKTPELSGNTLEKKSEQSEAKKTSSKAFASGKIHITSSDGMRMNTQEKRVDFHGNVVLVQEDLTLHCDHMTLFYEEIEGRQNMRELHAVGNVDFFQLSRELKGKSEDLLYNASSEILTLSATHGVAEIEQGKQSLKSKKILYNIATEAMDARGGMEITFELDEVKK